GAEGGPIVGSHNRCFLSLCGSRETQIGRIADYRDQVAPLRFKLPESRLVAIDDLQKLRAVLVTYLDKVEPWRTVLERLSKRPNRVGASSALMPMNSPRTVAKSLTGGCPSNRRDDHDRRKQQ